MDERIFILDGGMPNLEDYRDTVWYYIKMPLELTLRNLENGVQKTTEDAERAMAVFTSIMKLWDVLEEKVTKEIEKTRKARKKQSGESGQ
jgi:RNAse (barnase) inhibitor barstar